MDKEKISEALSYLDDDIIKETDALRQKKAKRQASGVIDITRKPWFKIGLAAAALVLILIGGGTVLSSTRFLGAKKSSRASEAMYMSEKVVMSMENTTAGIDSAEDPGSVDQYLFDNNATVTSAPRNEAPLTVAESYPAKTGTAGKTDYDASYIKTFCMVNFTSSAVSGTYGFDLSENADYYVSAGEAWELEVQNGDVWEHVDREDSVTWDEQVCNIGQYAGTNHFSRTFHLAAYGELKNGRYRIVKEIYVHRTVDGSENVYNDQVYFEFEVK